MFGTLLGYWQEKTAGDAVSALVNLIRIKTSVIRSGQKKEIPIEEVVPGDVITLSAGDVVPADVLLMAHVNATLQQGYKNPIDEAIAKIAVDGAETYRRVDEISYDFIRKRLSLLADNSRETILITKGSVKGVLEVCTQAVKTEGEIVPIGQVSNAIGVLLLFLHAGESEFQTGWFIESVVSATLIVWVVRTRNSCIKSRPGKYLTLASVLVASVALILPNLSFASLLGFTPVPFIFYVAMLCIVGLYIFSAERMKKWFYRH